MPSHKHSTARRRGRPSNQQRTQDEQNIQARGRALGVAELPRFQEMLRGSRLRLGIPEGGFESDVAAQVAWWDRLCCDEAAAKQRDLAAIDTALRAAGLEWAFYWEISGTFSAQMRAFMHVVQALQDTARLDDTWRRWVEHVLLTGEADDPATIPGPPVSSQAVTTPLQEPGWRTQRKELLSMTPTGLAVLRREDRRAKLEEKRTRLGVSPRNGVSQDRAALISVMKQHLQSGKSHWQIARDTEEGRQFIGLMGLTGSSREKQKTAIHNAVYEKPPTPSGGY